MSFRYLAGVAIVALAPLSLAAEPATGMPTYQYDEMAAKLIGLGYRSLNVVDASRGFMTAFDSDGAEVLLVVDASSRRLVSTTYVHRSDE